LFFAFAGSPFTRPRRSIAMALARLGLPEVSGFTSAILPQRLHVLISRHEAKADQPTRA
jgi:hypothetical protein